VEPVITPPKPAQRARPGARGRWLALLAIVAALVFVAAARMWLGGAGPTEADTRVLLELRGLRVASAAITGASLALAGALLQGLLRNPLASPDLLGLGSGAGLGVMVAIYTTFAAGGGLADPGGAGATGAAIAGSLGALTVVYIASQRGGYVEPTSLVLVGVIVGIMCAAGVRLFQHLLPDGGFAANRLMIGALRDDVSGDTLWVGLGLLAASLVVAMLFARAIDASQFSDDEARSMGVPLGAVRTVQFAAAALLSAGAVVIAGPVGFIGLVCPHVARMLVGGRASWLLPASVLLGAGAVIGADTLVAAIKAGAPGLGRVPVGVVTALVGGPVFIAMLRKHSRAL